MAEHYWELVTKDDVKYDIPPAAVPTVNKRMAAHDPIELRSATIPYSEIKHFRISSKPFGTQPLLEAAAQAFREPMFNEDGSMQARWVKKQVSQREYTKFYANIPAYRRLDEGGGMVTIAFVLPVHQINLERVEYCTEQELTVLK